MKKKIVYFLNRFLVPNIEAKKNNRWWWLPFIYPFIFVLLVLFIFMTYLSYASKKIGEVEVPNLQYKNIEEAKMILQQLELTYNVMDTINTDTLPDLTILYQYPESKLMVKTGRTILLSISSKKEVPIQMPNVVGLGLSSAVYMIRLQGLRIMDTLWQASDQAKYAVLQQLYNGNPIAEGKKLKKNAGIVLVVSSGQFHVAEQEIPSLIGLSIDEAKMLMQQFGLSIAPIHTEQKAEEEYIYRQFPQAGIDEKGTALTMPKNGSIEVWLKGK